MLKIARIDEEARGNRLMAWWQGKGAAPVLAQDGAALLMVRATGQQSLATMAAGGRDEDATRILCDVARQLHGRGQAPTAEFVPLETWFAALSPDTRSEPGIMAAAAQIAHELLQSQREQVSLHGDLHHGNVLDFGDSWKAIDPKGLYGERIFEFANLLRNPSMAVATAPGRLAAQATIISQRAGVDRQRLLQWTLALCGLSAAWLIEEGDEPDLDYAVADLVMAELGMR